MKYSDYVKADNIRKLLSRLRENNNPYLLEADEKQMIIDSLLGFLNSEQNVQASVAREDDSSNSADKQKQ
jgi:hypothetical protein